MDTYTRPWAHVYYPQNPAICWHPGQMLRYHPDSPHAGVHPFGVETCAGCGSRRRVEGDHDGPWRPPGVTPTWSARSGS